MTGKESRMSLPTMRPTSISSRRRRKAHTPAARLRTFAADVTPFGSDDVVIRLRRSTPVVRTLFPPPEARFWPLVRRQLSQAAARYEADRRAARRRHLKQALAVGAFAAAGGARLLRNN